MMAARGNPGRWLLPAACVLAVATVVAAYSNSFGNSFHFDDSHVVVENLFIRDLRNIPRFFRDANTFSSVPANAVYRPLVTTTVAIDYRLGGGLVRQFHVSQLSMLILLGALLYFLWLAIGRRVVDDRPSRYAAVFAAALFAAHTTSTETLNIISARSELLSAMGIVGSFLLYLHVPPARRSLLYLLPMIVGTLAKTPAVIFAPLLLAYVYLFERRLSLRDLFVPRSWPAVLGAVKTTLPAFVVGIATYVAVESQNSATVNYAGGSPYHYFLTQLYAWLHYGRLFVLPIGLTADSDLKLILEWYDTRVIAGALFVALLVRVIWVASRHTEWRPVAFGVSWYCITLLPGSSVVPLAEVINEHRVFLPYMGLAFAAAWALAQVVRDCRVRMPGWQRSAGVTAALVALAAVGAQAVGTYVRNRAYATEETLWRDVAQKSPGNGRGLMNYGLALMGRGAYAEAKQLFDRALVLNPNYASLEVNLAIVTDRLNDRAAAERHFMRALQLGPNEPPSHFFYARWLLDQNRAQDAIPHLERTVALSPAQIAARHLLMDGYRRVGRDGDAKALATETLAVAPGDAFAAQVLSGQAPASRVTNVPAEETAEGQLNRSLALYQAREFAGSIAAAKRALELRPDYAEAYNNIAAAHASMQRWDDAIVAAREALRLKPDFPLARNNLAWAESEKQKAR